jgi:hypothetical protein
MRTMFPRQLRAGRLLTHIVELMRVLGADLAGLECRNVFRAQWMDMSSFPAMVARGVQF